MLRATRSGSGTSTRVGRGRRTVGGLIVAAAVLAASGCTAATASHDAVPPSAARSGSAAATASHDAVPPSAARSGSAAATPVAANSPAAAPPSPVATSVAVFPIPGSATASPRTQVSFRGVDKAHLGVVTVIGSRSGAHGGTLLAHSDGAGVSFVPTRPFAAGERVTVRTTLHLLGAPGGTAKFTVARPVAFRPQPFGPTVSSPPAAQLRTFVSAPNLKPPAVTVRTDRAPAGEGVILVTPARSASGAGPMVLSTDGQPVWFHPLPAGQAATDLKVASYRGDPVLAWWQGTVVQPGFGQGRIEFYDTNYHPVADVGAGNGYQADLHDLQVTDHGSVFVTSYDPIRWDARSVGGARDQAVFDGVVQEVDIATGAVEFEWHSLDHVALTRSVLDAPSAADTPYDYFHLNSVDIGPAGDLLISGRHTSALFDIDATTGAVRWQLGGKGSDFRVPARAAFAYQHDARWQANGDITIFDNASRSASVKIADQSSVIELKLDTAAGTVGLVHRYTAPEKPLSTSQGDQQVLADGNVFVGWGGQPDLTEFSATGAVLYDATLAGTTSYRAYRQDWTGAPDSPPAWTVTSNGGSTTVHVSWNGDTRTHAWQLLSGPDPAHLHVAGSRPRTGFETAVTARDAGAYLAVRAVDSAGSVLVTSNARRG